MAGGEGAFLICTFWLLDNFIALGQFDKAKVLLNKLQGLSNDLGLFSEQVDGSTGGMLGNFPQAFSHLALINAAVQLQTAENLPENGRTLKKTQMTTTSDG